MEVVSRYWVEVVSRHRTEILSRHWTKVISCYRMGITSRHRISIPHRRIFIPHHRVDPTPRHRITPTSHHRMSSTPTHPHRRNIRSRRQFRSLHHLIHTRLLNLRSRLLLLRHLTRRGNRGFPSLRVPRLLHHTDSPPNHFLTHLSHLA